MDKKQRLIIIVINYGTTILLEELISNFLRSLPRFPRIRTDWVISDATDEFNVNQLEWENRMKELFKNKKNNFFHFFRLPNRGFAHNVNLSYQLFKDKMGEAHGIRDNDLLMLLNPDTSLFSPNVEKAVEFMNQNSKAMIAGMALINPRGQLEKWGHSISFPSLKLLFGRKRFSEPSNSTENTKVAWVSGGAMITRITWWESLAGLDDSFFLYFEDVDFCKRTKENGGEVYFLPGATVNHRRGGSDISLYNRKRYFYASEARYFRLYRSASEYLLLRLIRFPFKVFYFFRCYLLPSFWSDELKKAKETLSCEREKGFPSLVCLVQKVRETLYFKEIWGLVIIINLAVFFTSIWGRLYLGSPIVLHYNSYMGIDFYGDTWYLFIFPGLAFLVSLFNFVLGLLLLFSKRHSSVAVVTAGASLAFQLSMGVALLNLILVNR